MKIEDRLHDAMHDYADGIEPDPDSWSRITAPLRRSRARAVRRPAAHRRDAPSCSPASRRARCRAARRTRRPGQRNDAGGDPAERRTGDRTGRSGGAPPIGVLVAKRRRRAGGARHAGRSAAQLARDGSRGRLRQSLAGRTRRVLRREGQACLRRHSLPRRGQADAGDGEDDTGRRWRRRGRGQPGRQVSRRRRSCAGPSLGFTNLVTGANFGADALGSLVKERSPGISVVDPLGWSPDSTRLVYRVHLEGGHGAALLRRAPLARGSAARDRGGRAPSRSEHHRGGVRGRRDRRRSRKTSDPGPRSGAGRWVRGPPRRPSPVLFELPERVTPLVADPQRSAPPGGDRGWCALPLEPGRQTPTKLADGVTAATWSRGRRSGPGAP